MENLKITEAEEEDWEPAMEMVWKTFLKFEATSYGEEGTKTFLEFISNERIHEMFRIGNYKVVVAKVDERIVGVTSLRSGSHISLLFVDEEFHKRGIGTRLLAFLQDTYLRNGENKLTVNAAPYGVGFYEKTGFIKTDSQQTQDGVVYYPMTCLTKIIV